MNEVVVTGLGVVTPIGVGVEPFWAALVAGRSGAATISSFDASELPVTIACEASDFDPTQYIDARQIPRMARFTQMGVAAATLAWADADLDAAEVDRRAAGVIVGSGIGGLGTIEQEQTRFLERGARGVSPFMIPLLMPNAAAGAIAMHLGLNGPNFAPTSACATGAHALGEAFRYIKEGRADLILAGGSEAALTPLAVAAFARMGALSTRNDDPEGASRPFDSGRDGFVFGEGAGVLVLESRAHAERRGARVYARVLGYGASADAYHVTQPDPEGAGAQLAMRSAMAEANLEPSEVDYVNAHGTSTPFNDRIETIAIKGVLGTESKRIAVSSTKSQTGHLLGAAGAVEAAATVLTLQRSLIPRTINLTDPDPDCDLDHVGAEPRAEEVGVALSNSFGFGGQNACLAFGAA
ncbi:MAG: beta-ketoacyl-ACP synthase II [Actinomycetota bacterium]|nr:beta-ketoacyl-ACP synthase II [Actinomycetota bacterium]